jgi:assimilatory nitrate reductase catalytic subunit
MTASGVVRTTCPYCGVGCGVTVAPDGTIAGDPDHPANRGRLCSKGAALAEALGPADRLLQPQIAGRPADWNEALDLIAATFGRTVAEHGPDAVALYVSGQFLTEDYYVANKLMKGFIGTANIDTNSRLCMASSVAGHIRAFGEDLVPTCYDDLEAADLVVLVGSNAAWCHPVLYQRLAAAKAARGCRIVVIDPRRTATCDIADLHLALRPGADVALFAALLLHVVDAGACDRDWIATNTTGLAAAVEAARAVAPSLAAASRIADLPPDDLARFFGWFAATERTLTLYSQGVNQSTAGTDKVNAILNCHLATGRIGRPGMGPLSLTGQPNAMGGREVGGLANQLAAHMGFASRADIDRVRRFWRAPRLAEHPGLKAIELFEAVHCGRVRALWILGTNPAASMPRAGRVREALAACPFVVVSDCWPTDTTALADVVLPAAGWAEKDGTVTNSERTISRQRAFRRAPGAARPDWWMLTEVARRMGWGAAFAYRRPADIFREHAALSAFENGTGARRVFDIGALAGLGDAEYDTLPPVRWPLPRGYPAAAGPPRLFGDGRRFPTADGRARFVPTPYRPPVAETDQEWPLLLNTGRLRDQWHTMTRTGRLPRLMAHRREPQLDIHPSDAAPLGLVDGSLVRVASRHGETVMPVRLSADQRIGNVFAPMHWTDRFASSGPIGRLVGAAADPVSGQPELKATPVRLTAVRVRWHGAVLRRSEGLLPPGPYYWSRAPLASGHTVAIAGWEDLPSGPAGAAWVAALLDAPASPEMVIYADPRRGVFRYASLIDDRLDACLFLAPAGVPLPPLDRPALRLGAAVPAEARASLLAARSAAAGSPADPGPTVCACFGVGLRTLHEAITSRRLASLREIGTTLGAGTNCGSCIPELKAALQSVGPDHQGARAAAI